jgi:hypothetical protein
MRADWNLNPQEQVEEMVLQAEPASRWDTAAAVGIGMAAAT